MVKKLAISKLVSENLHNPTSLFLVTLTHPSIWGKKKST